ncbi:hypothetical protein K4A83_03735 [Spirulina subsalsa FACHB-351]|uniref:Uncharacterized protein n=1 Tax=Spirulina subsalsa FACHB-351 TaxID=234711 RepID=A0ABT3L1R3_9CYAN|nr:hypothetical protein [Spirulina subsalsa]MCW6035387.1 hypothetical protein [Spirulina subsalsa FACHB-351]
MSHQVIAFLIKSLYDTLEQSKSGKGVVILSVMLPDTFLNIMGLPGGTPERISTFTHKKAIDLKFVNGVSMVELVKLYLNLFYNKKAVIPPHELYPFDEAEITQYAQTNKPTVREALRWCAQHFKVAEDTLPTEAKGRFEFALTRETEDDYSDDLEDNQFIGDVLRFGFKTLIGESLQGETSTGELLKQMTVTGIEDITPKSKNNNWINFKIVVKEEGQEIKIGLMVLQNNHGLSVGAGMNRIIDYETFGFNRGCLVRSHEKKIKENWDSHAHLEFLIQKLGGEWVDLKLEEVKPLIQLYNVYQQRDYYKLEEQDILNFAKEITVKNPLLREVLSNPASNIDSLIQDFIDEVSVEGEQNSDDADLMNNELVFDLPNSSDTSEMVSSAPATPDNPKISSAVDVTTETPTEETQTKVDTTSSKTTKTGKSKTSTAGKGKIAEVSKTVESDQSQSSKPSAKATSGKTKPAEKSPPPAVEQSSNSKPSAKATSTAKTKAASQKAKSIEVEQKAPPAAVEKSPPVTLPPVEDPEKQWFEKSYSGQTIVAFHFNGERYETESWKDFLINVCILIKLNHSKDFYKVQEAVKGRTRYFFTTKPEDLRKAEKISGTNLYVETSLSANDVVKLIKKIVDLFEYPADVIAIETHE